MSHLYFAHDFQKHAIQKHFGKPDFLTYVTFKHLLIKVANDQDFKKEYKLETEFYDPYFEPERLKTSVTNFY